MNKNLTILLVVVCFGFSFFICGNVAVSAVAAYLALVVTLLPSFFSSDFSMVLVVISLLFMTSTLLEYQSETLMILIFMVTLALSVFKTQTIKVLKFLFL